MVYTISYGHSLHSLCVLNVRRYYMIRESIARLCTLRMGVNTIHSLISLKNFADALRGRNAHRKKYFQTRGWWKTLKTVVSYF